MLLWSTVRWSLCMPNSLHCPWGESRTAGQMQMPKCREKSHSKSSACCCRWRWRMNVMVIPPLPSLLSMWVLQQWCWALDGNYEFCEIKALPISNNHSWSKAMEVGTKPRYHLSMCLTLNMQLIVLAGTCLSALLDLSPLLLTNIHLPLVSRALTEMNYTAGMFYKRKLCLLWHAQRHHLGFNEKSRF